MRRSHPNPAMQPAPAAPAAKTPGRLRSEPKPTAATPAAPRGRKGVVGKQMTLREMDQQRAARGIHGAIPR